jgi:cytochrome c5
MKFMQSLTLAIAAAVLAPAAMAAPAAKGGVNGEKIYAANCASCHAAGVLGAPKAGDKAAWAPRVKQGKEVLYTHGLNGFKMMPPKGGNPGLKDDEVKAAIDFMTKS